MNTCKDCKWWMSDSAICLVAPRLVGSGDKPTILGYIGSDSAAPIAETENLDSIDLRTGPDFGCIKWEAKDEPG